jgi:ABC-type uncharacterized transport system ATPase subunit
MTDASGVVERLKGVTFHVDAGEILGIAGVAGNGQSALLQVLGGLAPATGTLNLDGRPLDIRHGDLGQERGMTASRMCPRTASIRV